MKGRIMEPIETETKNKNNKKKRKPKRSKKISAIIIVLEMLFIAVAVYILSLNISLNSNDKIDYADSDIEDEISYQDGKLIVNNVVAKVPSKGNVSYNVSYSWGKDDQDYPTIPHSVTAIYKSKEGAPKYDITLYRDSFIPKKELPKGKDAENWFSDWEVVDGEDIKQHALDTEKVHGFIIDAVENNSGSEQLTTYETSTYYFAVQSKKGISVYILEGIIYESDSLESFQKAMNRSINSISIKKK